MKYGVIDIGSNSVRLLISEDGETQYKLVRTTRLATALGKDGNLYGDSVENTLASLSFFAEKAREEGVDELYAFATAAVRKAKNAQQFKAAVKDRCGIGLDILSGEEEAEAGMKGAISGEDGGVIDIGGASTEICVVKSGKKIYGVSLPIGAVNLTAKFGEDEQCAIAFLKEKLKEYGSVPKADFRFIGGTASSIASMLLRLETFDFKKVDGFVIEKSHLVKLKDELYSKTAEERKNIIGLQKERADIIQSGVVILYCLFEYLGINSVKESESDNLEGYLNLKLENL